MRLIIRFILASAIFLLVSQLINAQEENWKAWLYDPKWYEGNNSYPCSNSVNIFFDDRYSGVTCCLVVLDMPEKKIIGYDCIAPKLNSHLVQDKIFVITIDEAIQRGVTWK